MSTSKTSNIEIEAIDHVVWIVADARASVDWYGRVLGLKPERLEEWEAGEVPFVSIRIDAHTIIDLFEGERTGQNVDHVSLRVASTVDLRAVAARDDIELVSGPTRIWGARGDGLGIYINDPDGNTIELKHYA